MRYRGYLNKTLQARLDEFIDSPHHELVSLYEELSLAKCTVVDAVQLYDAACKEGVAPETRVCAGGILREAFADIADLVKACDALEQSAKDKVSLRVLALFVEQIIRAIYNAMPDEPEKAKAIEKRIRRDVKFPSAGNDTGGDVLSPSQAVAAMDSSIGGGIKDVQGEMLQQESGSDGGPDESDG
jgi:hypothetical protein